MGRLYRERCAGRYSASAGTPVACGLAAAGAGASASEAGAGEEDGRDRQIADRDHRRLADADRLAVHEAEEGQRRRRASAKADAFVNCRSMMKTAIAPSMRPPRIDAAAHGRRGPRKGRPSAPSLSNPTAAALVPAAAERVVDLQLAPRREVRHQREDDRGRVALGRLLERLRADEHADVEQDRRDGDDRNQRRHHRDDAEPGQHDHREPVAAE